MLALEWVIEWEIGDAMARTHVVLADEVMSAVDNVVGERGRSRFLEDAAREKLDRLELEAALRETAGTLDRGKHPEWRDRASTRQWVRDARRTETA
jgi:metal-responsive CopG/Arc/MetJ family transcriptional regulator